MYCVLPYQLTFKLESELIGIVEGEHLLVRRLLICVEDELSGEHEHGKVSFHQLRLSMLLLLHWLQLSSSPSPSTVCLGPPPLSPQTIKLCKLPLSGNGTSRSHRLRAMTWYCEETQVMNNKVHLLKRHRYATYLHFVMLSFLFHYIT